MMGNATNFDSIVNGFAFTNWWFCVAPPLVLRCAAIGFALRLHWFRVR